MELNARRVRWVSILIVFGIALILGLSGFYEVKQGEQAVVLTFGRITDSKEAGLYWHIPMIQEVRKQSDSQ